MRFDVVIVGCGFAGAATAFHLSRHGPVSILLIDKEEVPGYHASGRNASLILQSVADPLLRTLTATSRRAYEDLAGVVSFHQHGSLLLGTRETLQACRDLQQVESIYRDPAQIRARIPLLRDHPFDLALETPTDGVIDISALLQFYLRGGREAGVEIRSSCELESVTAAGPLELRTSHGTFQAEVLVNAAGAWAARIAELAGATRIPLRPLKRHLFVLDLEPPLPDDLPFVWDLEKEFYLRPESGGALFSICDETPATCLEPIVEPAIMTRLAEVVVRELPSAGGATLRRAWSCFRTKAADERLVIGPDPRMDRFFWVAGLAGHGMATSWEVGRIAAEIIGQRRKPPPELAADRFRAGASGDRLVQDQP